ncbi:MAG: electron transfer flavoprotein subunit beta/FixA family protein [Proteobacteria bacterium]|nr:electron transfer flavoprotein subunit beta/FixA family protein [Pseudomonadota bacterium]
MKILVPLKRVPDPELKTKIQDGAVDLSNVSWVVNPFDEYAVEAALRLVENADDGSRHGEVVVLTLGPDDAAAQLRSALAMGADRAIRIEANDDEIDAGTVVDALVAIIDAEKPDIVLMGKQAVDGDSNQAGQMLAGKLAWPQATFAASIELAGDKSTVTVGREVDAGVEYKKIPLPGIITADLRIISPRAVINHITPDSHEYQDGPRYASLKGIMKAKKKPMDVKSMADIGVTAAPVIKRVSVELPPQRPAGQIVESVQELVAKLNEEAKAL